MRTRTQDTRKKIMLVHEHSGQRVPQLRAISMRLFIRPTCSTRNTAHRAKDSVRLKSTCARDLLHPTPNHLVGQPKQFVPLRFTAAAQAPQGGDPFPATAGGPENPPTAEAVSRQRPRWPQIVGSRLVTPPTSRPNPVAFTPRQLLIEARFLAAILNLRRPL